MEPGTTPIHWVPPGLGLKLLPHFPRTARDRGGTWGTAMLWTSSPWPPPHPSAQTRCSPWGWGELHPRIPFQMLVGATGHHCSHSWDTSGWLGPKGSTATSPLLPILLYGMLPCPAQPPAPAMSLPFAKSSCSQPNPLRLPLSHCSIFKLMPGRAWDRRKLTLGRGQPLRCLLKTEALFPVLLPPRCAGEET